MSKKGMTQQVSTGGEKGRRISSPDGAQITSKRSPLEKGVKRTNKTGHDKGRLKEVVITSLTQVPHEELLE